MGCFPIFHDLPEGNAGQIDKLYKDQVKHWNVYEVIQPFVYFWVILKNNRVKNKIKTSLLFVVINEMFRTRSQQAITYSDVRTCWQQICEEKHADPATLHHIVPHPLCVDGGV